VPENSDLLGLPVCSGELHNEVVGLSQRETGGLIRVRDLSLDLIDLSGTMIELSVTVPTTRWSKSQNWPAGSTTSNEEVLLACCGPLAHAAVLPATGVSTPNTVPTVNTAPAMTDRLMVTPL